MTNQRRKTFQRPGKSRTGRLLGKWKRRLPAGRWSLRTPVRSARRVLAWVAAAIEGYVMFFFRAVLVVTARYVGFVFGAWKDALPFPFQGLPRKLVVRMMLAAVVLAACVGWALSHGSDEALRQHLMCCQTLSQDLIRRCDRLRTVWDADGAEQRWGELEQVEADAVVPVLLVFSDQCAEQGDDVLEELHALRVEVGMAFQSQRRAIWRGRWKLLFLANSRATSFEGALIERRLCRAERLKALDRFLADAEWELRDAFARIQEVSDFTSILDRRVDSFADQEWVKSLDQEVLNLKPSIHFIVDTFPQNLTVTGVTKW